ncbi:von Willebrand factor-like, partial [Acanthaster planci]|uniref:von Willebrand factor-like n=1 Tax=Acanthaster planci TaxID=133434 RepID=A0A8B8A3G9_ACAPL
MALHFWCFVLLVTSWSVRCSEGKVQDDPQNCTKVEKIYYPNDFLVGGYLTNVLEDNANQRFVRRSYCCNNYSNPQICGTPYCFPECPEGSGHCSWRNRSCTANAPPLNERQTPAPEIQNDGECSICCGGSVRTFDGLYFNFPIMCRQILTHYEHETDSFTVDIIPNYSCNASECFSAVNITIPGFTQNILMIELLPRGDVLANSRSVNTPFETKLGHKVFKEGLRVVFLSVDGRVKVSFDGINSAIITVSRLFADQGQTLQGLCGTYDNIPDNDLDGGTVAEFVNKFRAPWGRCTSLAMSVPNLFDSLTDDQRQNVTRICNEFAVSSLVARGSSRVPVHPFLNSCNFSVSLYLRSGLRYDICSIYADYAHACSRHGIPFPWRSSNFCPIQCSNGMVYNECGSTCRRTCQNMFYSEHCATHCVPGCECPAGTYFDGSLCVAQEECPCALAEESLPVGAIVKDTCRDCTCLGGRLGNCTVHSCPGTCTILRGRSFTTFDGTSYEFDGDCEYVLVQTSNSDSAGSHFSIYMDKTQCRAYGLRCESPPVISVKTPDGHLYEFSAGLNTVSVGTQRRRKINLPYQKSAGNSTISITLVSSIFTRVAMSELGIELLLGKDNRLYITAEERLLGKINGLCGNFNRKNGDDFQLPPGSTAAVASQFAPTWNSDSQCQESTIENSIDYCDIEAVYYDITKSECRKVKRKPFSECNFKVDTSKFYKQCWNDRCAGSVLKGAECLAMAAYAWECAKTGLVINWRNQKLCPIECPAGMVYKECGSMCKMSCYDLGNVGNCREQCIQGCQCSDGKVFDDEEKKCVPVSKCHCYHNGRIFQPDNEWREGCNDCFCRNGVTECSQGNCTDIGDECPEGLGRIDCVECERRCSNMHLDCKAERCTAGCGCNNGTVRAPDLKTCIREDKCPCYFNGRSYKHGKKFKKDCNKCKCLNEKIKCRNKICPATCRAYGDPHYITYDGSKYNFQGDCRYILTTDGCDKEKTFEVIVENIACGSEEVTCTKAVVFHFFDWEVTLVRGSEPKITNSDGYPRLKCIRNGIYDIIITDRGIRVDWDRATSVSVTVDGKYYKKTCGLCGIFDDNRANDFTTRQNEQASVTVFGHSWRKSDSCPMPQEPDHMCDLFPMRREYAISECKKLIYHSVFKECHKVIDPEDYYDNCVFDTCGCNRGGDCECLCTAVTTYSRQCSEQGLTVFDWRYVTPPTCSILCKPPMEYACKSTPESSCVLEELKMGKKLWINKGNYEMKGCYEGCHCPNGTKRLRNTCVPKCPCIVDGREVQSRHTFVDECQSCICNDGKWDCEHSPSCTPGTTTSTSSVTTSELTTPYKECDDDLDSEFSVINVTRFVSGNRSQPIDPVDWWTPSSPPSSVSSPEGTSYLLVEFAPNAKLTHVQVNASAGDGIAVNVTVVFRYRKDGSNFNYSQTLQGESGKVKLFQTLDYVQNAKVYHHVIDSRDGSKLKITFYGCESTPLPTPPIPPPACPPGMRRTPCDNPCVRFKCSGYCYSRVLYDFTTGKDYCCACQEASGMKSSRCRDDCSCPNGKVMERVQHKTCKKCSCTNNTCTIVYPGCITTTLPT